MADRAVQIVAHLVDEVDVERDTTNANTQLASNEPNIVGIQMIVPETIAIGAAQEVVALLMDDENNDMKEAAEIVTQEIVEKPAKFAASAVAASSGIVDHIATNEVAIDESAKYEAVGATIDPIEDVVKTGIIAGYGQGIHCRDTCSASDPHISGYSC